MCHVGMQAGSGIAEILALEISRQENKSVDEARKRIWLMDSKVILIPYLHTYVQS
jgi:malate dehydrogenase (oxaloacetate-decarboxylating)(NADP+)